MRHFIRLPWTHFAGALLMATIACGTTAQAKLTIAPVFNRGAGSGPGPGVIGLAAATPLREPDQHFAYVSGDPRKVELDDLLFLNDTPYNMTGFSLRIIGTGTDTDDPGTIVLDDTVDAVFGDVAGHPISSDIFQQIEITENGKAIHFRDGLIPPGGRFTDLHFAYSDLVSPTNPYDYAAIDSWFVGAVPEPSSTLLGALALLSLFGFRQRRR